MKKQILIDALEFLLEVKSHKDIAGKDAWYNANQPRAWEQATEALAAASQSTDKENKDVAKEYSIFCSKRAWYDDETELWNLFNEQADPFRYSNDDFFNAFKDKSHVLHSL